FSVERDTVVRWLSAEIGVGDEAASQLYDYLLSGNRALGVMPTQKNLVIERFFDESGGMQLVLHSPFGSAVNRAWGLALRKRFCRTFNFELQAAAIEDAIVISLGSVHSFELSEVWRYLAPETVRDVLTQAVLDVPMFNIRWRWVANCALALPRFRGGKKVPPRLQRMNAKDLAALLFPDQLACAENLNGAREIPDHPLIEQALQDCLTEAMDIGTLESLLTDVVAGKKRLVSLDVTEPSPFAQEILNANPYAFLDDAPLEERRTQAVQSRRWLDPETASDLGALDESAIARVADELIPIATSADELHETLLLMGCLTTGEASTLGGRAWESWFEQLQSEKRALLVEGGSSPSLWVASERYGELRQLWRSRTANPNFRGGALEMFPALDADEALVSLVRARVDNSAPQTSQHLADLLGMPERDISIALASLEARGIVFRGRYLPSEDREQWCDRRVLARIHRYTVKRLRSEIEPVPATTYLRFLFDWQGLSTNARRQGAYSTVAVIEQLSGFETAAQAWESEIIPARVSDYRRDYLDQNHLNGKLVWLRLTGKRSTANSSNGPFKSTPMSLLPRTDLKDWLAVQPADNSAQLSGAAKRVLGVLEQRGAAFFDDIVDRCGILKSQCEQALGELAAGGYVTSDSYEGLRVLLIAPSRRRPLNGSRRRNVSISSIDSAGRW
ncbi:MAG: ATP-dependent DNA helicase, partial [Gammaproteobacteria bacterium]